jgi:hypothetical protein
MGELMTFANDSAKQVDALVSAAVISFGFVFIHPFMDGNGRLSRFLFRQTLCQSGRLADGVLLPILSAVRKHDPSTYALYSRSRTRAVTCHLAGHGSPRHPPSSSHTPVRAVPHKGLCWPLIVGQPVRDSGDRRGNWARG